MSFDQFMTEDARLIMLRELASQANGTLNETIMVKVLETFAHNRSRDWVRGQFAWLASVGAVKVVEAGSVHIASITRAGLDHVERKAILPGVARPSPEN